MTWVLAGVGLMAASVALGASALVELGRLRRRRVLLGRLGRASGAPVPGSRRLLRGLARLGWPLVPAEPDRRAREAGELLRAGFGEPEHLAVFYGLRAAAALAGLALPIAEGGAASGFARGHLAAALALAGGAYFAGGAIPGLLRRRRTSRLDRELPDVLDMVLVGLDAGLGLGAALARAGRDLGAFAPLLAAELERFGREVRAGAPRAEALERLRARNDHAGLSAVVGVMEQSIAYGTDLAASLRLHAEALREERRQRAQARAARTPVLLTFPLVLFVLPALLIVIVGPAALQLASRLGGGG